MKIESIVVYSTGVLFCIIATIIALIIYLREKPVQEEAMFFFRIIIALGGAGFAILLTGFINIDLLSEDYKITVGGTFAIFIIIYLINPSRLKKKIN